MNKFDDYLVELTFIDKEGNNLSYTKGNNIYPINSVVLDKIFGFGKGRIDYLSIQDLRFLLVDEYDIFVCKNMDKVTKIDENIFLKVENVR